MAGVVEAKGSDAFWQVPLEELLPERLRSEAPRCERSVVHCHTLQQAGCGKPCRLSHDVCSSSQHLGPAVAYALHPWARMSSCRRGAPASNQASSSEHLPLAEGDRSACVCPERQAGEAAGDDGRLVRQRDQLGGRGRGAPGPGVPCRPLPGGAAMRACMHVCLPPLSSDRHRDEQGSTWGATLVAAWQVRSQRVCAATGRACRSQAGSGQLAAAVATDPCRGPCKGCFRNLQSLAWCGSAACVLLLLPRRAATSTAAGSSPAC